MTYKERTEEQLEEALDTIDDMVNTISERIISIAHDNEDFICSCCIRTAKTLFGLLKDYAREEDVTDISEQWKDITGREIED